MMKNKNSPTLKKKSIRPKTERNITIDNNQVIKIYPK